MTRSIIANCRSAAWVALVGGAVAILSAWNSPALGQALTYVDADDLGGNFGPLSAVNSGANVNDDLLWGFRAFGAANTIFESGIGENSPTLNQTLTGLTPGKSYDLYSVFWTDKDENWTMQAGTTAGNMSLYSWRGSTPAFGVPGSQQGVTAGAAVWAVPPPPTVEGTVFTQRPADPLVMLLAKAGTASASGGGTLDVFVDDRGVNAAGTRTWFDGVAYVDAGTTIALTATINRATGELVVANPTSQPFQIKGITLDSPGGVLSTEGWTPIAGRLDAGGNSSFDTHPWVVTPPATMPFATQLAEAEDAAGGGSGGTLAAGGASLSLGNVWAKSPTEDIRLSLTLADDTLVLMSPSYTGTAIQNGDFDGNGLINVADFQTLLTNLHTNVSTLPGPSAYLRGDMTGDRNINFADFSAFRTAYDAANGAGAFAKVAGVVPEPGTLSMVAAGGVALALLRRRRMACVVCVVLTSLTCGMRAEAQSLLAVDVNDREAPDATDDTAPGFQAFTLDGAGIVGSTTRVINGYTVTVAGVDATNNPTVSIDDRDRGTPTTAPTFNQLYDDFIFSTAASGVGGGFNLTVSGGMIQPNTVYRFSLYSFDTGSTGATRVANWVDGNNGDAALFSTSFAGATSPTTDEQYKFTGIARSSATGELLLKGRNALADTTPGVFINGFEIGVPIELTLEVNKTTGLLRVVNEQNVNFDMIYYEVRSPSGALNTSWAGLDGAEGGDPVGMGWDKAGGSTANLLSEVNLTGASSFAPAASTSLGNGFAVAGAEDLRFFYAQPTGALRQGVVKYVTGGGGHPADFNGDGTVNAADLAQWRNDFGANAGSDADGDGDSDGNDFLLWQRNLGATGATGNLAAVPEPRSLLLATLVGGVLAGKRRRR